MAKHKNKTRKDPSREDKLANYRASLPRNPVSDTAGPTYDDISGTADYRSSKVTYSAVGSAYPAPTFFSKYFKEIMTVIGIIITLITIISGAVYKFGILEKSVDYVQKNVAALEARLSKLEDRINTPPKRK